MSYGLFSAVLSLWQLSMDGRSVEDLVMYLICGYGMFKLWSFP